MDFKLFATTLVAVFLAEIGDKTQLATLALSSGTSSRWSVFFGAALALIATTALAVLGGEIVTRFVSPALLRKIAGATFIALGVLYLFGRGA